jgi:hypothetical protein
MIGIAGLWRCSHCREIARVAVGDCWSLDVLVSLPSSLADYDVSILDRVGGYSGPLYRCSLCGNKEAGQKYWAMPGKGTGQP